MKVSIITLKKSAILATLFTGYGSAFIYYQIQKRVSSGSFYKKTEDAVRLNEEVCVRVFSSDAGNEPFVMEQVSLL